MARIKAVPISPRLAPGLSQAGFCRYAERARRPPIERIREKIGLRQYDMTAHATEEMAEDDLTILDIEHAVPSGRVVEIQRDDPRGRKHA